MGPIVAAHLDLELAAGGWTLFMRHKHLGGMFMDCPPSQYSGLSSGELVDVIDAELYTHGH